MINKLSLNTAFFCLLVLLAGCLGVAPMPETNNERLALFETSYGAVLDTATLYATEGRLTDVQKTVLDQSFNDVEAAINLARLALDAADQLTFDNNAANITAALGLIRTILTEAE